MTHLREIVTFLNFIAPVVKLVDTQDSGSCASNGVMVRLHSGAPFFKHEECFGNGAFLLFYGFLAFFSDSEFFSTVPLLARFRPSEPQFEGDNEGCGDKAGLGSERIRHAGRISNLHGKACQKNAGGALLFGEMLSQFAAGEMVTAARAVFLALFGRAAIIFIMKEVVFGFFPGHGPSEPFAHIPFVLIDGMSVLPNLPFIEI